MNYRVKLEYIYTCAYCSYNNNNIMMRLTVKRQKRNTKIITTKKSYKKSYTFCWKVPWVTHVFETFRRVPF